MEDLTCEICGRPILNGDDFSHCGKTYRHINCGGGEAKAPPLEQFSDPATGQPLFRQKAEAGGVRKVRVIGILPPADRDRVERIARGESITEADAHFMSRILSTVIASYGQKTNEPPESPAKVVMPSEGTTNTRPDTTPAGVIGGLTENELAMAESMLLSGWKDLEAKNLTVKVLDLTSS